MHLKPSASQDAVAAPFISVKSSGVGPGLAAGLSAGSQGAAASGPTDFARMLEAQQQNSKHPAVMTSGLPTITSQEAKQQARASNLAHQESRTAPKADMGSPQDNTTTKPVQVNKADSDVGQGSKRLLQSQADRSRLQAQSESRASAARGAPQHSNPAAAKKNSSELPSGRTSETAEGGVEEAGNTDIQASTSPLALMQWLQASGADLPAGIRIAPEGDATEEAIASARAEVLAGAVPVATRQLGMGSDKAGQDASNVVGETAPDSLSGAGTGADGTSSTTSRSKHQGLSRLPETSSGNALASEPQGNVVAGKLEPAAVAHASTEIAAVLAVAADGASHSSRTEQTNAIDFAALLAGQTGTTPLDKASPVSVQLSTPVQSPAFREQLAAQVTLLAKDGVQAAELHLNPADMGPISVQITLDGTQARVDFGADSASTRQLIESGIPELASAMQEAGLTLSGGGVSQHARGRADQDTDSQQVPLGQREDVKAEDRASSTPIMRRVALGGIDVFA